MERPGPVEERPICLRFEAGQLVFAGKADDPFGGFAGEGDAVRGLAGAGGSALAFGLEGGFVFGGCEIGQGINVRVGCPSRTELKLAGQMV